MKGECRKVKRLTIFEKKAPSQNFDRALNIPLTFVQYLPVFGKYLPVFGKNLPVFGKNTKISDF